MTPKHWLRAAATAAVFAGILFAGGTDFDHIHPTCTGAPNGTCLPAPFDGALLQIMPWPIFHNMTYHDLHAIYEYLSAIPCINNTWSHSRPH